MKMSKSTTIIISLVIFSLFSFIRPAKDEYQNKTKLALVPFFGADGAEVNQAYFSALKKAGYELADSAKIRHAIENHELFNRWIRTVDGIGSAKVKPGYYTYEGLTGSEIEMIRSNTQNAVFLLTPSAIKKRTVTKPNGTRNVYHLGSLTIVDLKTGKIKSVCKKKTKLKFDFMEPMAEVSFLALVDELVTCIE